MTGLHNPHVSEAARGTRLHALTCPLRDRLTLTCLTACSSWAAVTLRVDFTAKDTRAVDKRLGVLASAHAACRDGARRPLLLRACCPSG